MTGNSDPAIIGDVGESAVETMLLRLGWNVWSTNNRDKGTDLIVLTKDIDRPVAFGVQVRSGRTNPGATMSPAASSTWSPSEAFRRPM